MYALTLSGIRARRADISRKTLATGIASVAPDLATLALCAGMWYLDWSISRLLVHLFGGVLGAWPIVGLTALNLIQGLGRDCIQGVLGVDRLTHVEHDAK